MRAYYNEIDRYCCDWLQNLMDAGHITPGKIDDRSIADVRPEDVEGFERCHFFAGIAGWELALQMSGYTGPVWTGSCPCQPFSAAGKGKASGDERHLWPEWFRLIRAVRPPVIFGEQVEAAVGWGWLDLVHSDMESEGYTIRATVLPACSVGAPHIRQRLWFVADTLRSGATNAPRQGLGAEAEANKEDGGISGERLRLGKQGATGELADSPYNGQSRRQGTRPGRSGATYDGSFSGPWHNLIWLPCTDGKQRPTQPGIFPLAHGVSGRVAVECPAQRSGTEVQATRYVSRAKALKGAGNAIVPQVASQFIKASM